MENVLKKKGHHFKVKNTWKFYDIWEQGGKEKFLSKVLKDLNAILNLNTEIGRVKLSYTYYEGKTFWFCFDTLEQTVKVNLLGGQKMNNGTWFTIGEIKVEQNEKKPIFA